MQCAESVLCVPVATVRALGLVQVFCIFMLSILLDLPLSPKN